MRFSREDIDRVLENVNPVDVLDLCGSKVFTASNNDIRSCCPLHNGRDPNFSTFYDSIHHKWRFKCFSHACEKRVPYGSDMLGLLMAARGLRFTEALEMLANLAGIILMPENETLLDRFERESIKSYTAELSSAKRYEVDTYPEIHIDNLVDNGWGIIDKYLRSPERNSKLEDVVDFGLYPGNDKTGCLRLYIPIRDHEGRLIGLTGRMLTGVLNYPPIMRKNGTVKKAPKYDNSPGLKKSGVLYNLDRAKKFSGKGLVIVEGQFDAIRMHNYGYQNTIAKMGSVLSDKQVALLYKYCTSVILLVEEAEKVDPDTGRIISIDNRDVELEKLSYGMKVKVAYLKKDPDSSSKEEIDNAIREAELIKNI